MANTTTVNYYVLLGVKKDAPLKEINTAYKKLALQLHPDKMGNTKEAVDKFQKIQQAVETLRDPDLRRKHDATLEVELPSPPTWVAATFSQKQTDSDEWLKEHCSQWQRSAHYQYKSTDPWGRYVYSHGDSVHMNPNARFAKEEAARHEDDLNSWENEYAGVDPEVEKAKAELLQEAMRARFKRKEEDEMKARAEEFQGSQGTMHARFRQREKEQNAKAEKLQEMLREMLREMLKEKLQEAAMRTQFEEEKAKAMKLQQAMRDLLQRREEERKAAEEAAKGIDTDDEPFVYWEPEYHSTAAFADSEDSEDSAYFTGPRSAFAAETVEDFEFYHVQEEPRQEPAAFEYYRVREEPRQDQARQKPAAFEYCWAQREPRQNAGFSHNAHFAATAEPAGQKSPIDGVNYMPQAHANILEAIRPLLPYYEAKLKNTRHSYTADEAKEELQGVILEAYSIWASATGVALKADTPDRCAHRGIWRKEFNCPRCEECHTWRPLFVLTCPTCGMKACVRCKYL